jgi:hypothetical protein
VARTTTSSLRACGSVRTLLPSLFSPSFLAHETCAGVFGHAGFNHCEIKWDGLDDSRSMVIVHDNSTNGTWVRVFCYRTSSTSSVVPPPPPFTLDASKRAYARTHTHAHIHSHRSTGYALSEDNLPSYETETRSRSARRCNSKLHSRTTASYTGISPQWNSRASTRTTTWRTSSVAARSRR